MMPKPNKEKSYKRVPSSGPVIGWMCMRVYQLSDDILIAASIQHNYSMSQACFGPITLTSHKFLQVGTLKTNELYCTFLASAGGFQRPRRYLWAKLKINFLCLQGTPSFLSRSVRVSSSLWRSPPTASSSFAACVSTPFPTPFKNSTTPTLAW